MTPLDKSSIKAYDSVCVCVPILLIEYQLSQPGTRDKMEDNQNGRWP